MDGLKLDEKKSIEDAAHFSFTENKAVGVAFWIGMMGIIIMRKNIGVRMLKIEMVLFTISGLYLFANIATYFSQLPLIGKGLSYSSFKLFTLIYGICAIIHLIRGFLESRKIPYTFTRSLGESRLQEIVFAMNLPFIGKSTQRVNSLIDPLVFFVLAEIVYHFLSPNLGAFMMFITICMIIIEVVLFRNDEELRHNQNDSMVLAKHTQTNIKGDKGSKTQSRVMSQVKKPSQKK